MRIPEDELTLVGGRSPLPWAVEAAIKLIESRQFPVQRMISHVFPLAQAAEALRATTREDLRYSDVIKVAVRPWL
jgi:threonine dehydrogenase-like Zn-dependent dehydrogenase